MIAADKGRWPVLLSYGFRPFFLLASIFAGLSIPVWLCAYWGEITIGGLFQSRDWHVHEMIFGYVPGVVAGFLLTAIPNWTGRLPVRGAPLLVLVSAWVAGRLAVLLSAWLGWIPTMLIDLLFLALVLAVAMREIVAGSNWRNLRVVALVGLLGLGNGLFHVEVHLYGVADLASRLGIAAAVLLISLIGGRIIPSFTRNWLMRHDPGARLPAAFGRFDMAVVAASAASLVLWIAIPDSAFAGPALAVVGAAHLARLARWAGERTFADPLVLILHVGYAFVPAGFLLTGAASFGLVPAATGMHAWAAAIATMTLAVMTRASLGHTGRPLHAGTATTAVYAAVVVAGLARIGAAGVPDWSALLLPVSGIAWVAAFLGFAVAFFPVLCLPSKSAN